MRIVKVGNENMFYYFHRWFCHAEDGLFAVVENQQGKVSTVFVAEIEFVHQPPAGKTMRAMLEEDKRRVP